MSLDRLKRLHGQLHAFAQNHPELVELAVTLGDTILQMETGVSPMPHPPAPSAQGDGDHGTQPPPPAPAPTPLPIDIERSRRRGLIDDIERAYGFDVDTEHALGFINNVEGIDLPFILAEMTRRNSGKAVKVPGLVEPATT